MKKTLSLICLAASITGCTGPVATPLGEVPSANPDINARPNPYPTFRGSDTMNGEKNFAVLINNNLQGKVEPTPWAGYWWPYTKNGIAAGGFMSNASPAGKYDAARGRTTHAQEWEIRNHGATVPKVQSWWGHCNGWTAASSLFPEPNASVTVNGIQFDIGDIKALLTEAGMSANADFFGDRIDVDNPDLPKYWDTIPNQYFLVLTNYIGKLKHPVLIDRYTGSQVWNQPLAAYRFEYPKPVDYIGNSPDAPNVYKIMLTSTIWWLDDGVAPDVQTPPFSYDDDGGGIFQNRTLRMEVWVDAPIVFESTGKIQSSGNIIVTRQGDHLVGGAWRMGEGLQVDAWPDYMWVPHALVKATDPEQDYVNPEIDLEWIKAHILPAGGVDDPSVEPSPVVTAPIPSPSGFPWPFPTSGPWPGPTPRPRP